MKTISRNRFVLLLLAAGILALGSCSAGFKKKMEVAATLRESISAEAVSVGYEAKNNTSSGKKAVTTLTFSGVKPDGWDELGIKIASNLLAYRFLKGMPPQDISGETDVAIVVEMTNGNRYINEFPISELNEAGPLIEVADKAVQACISQNKQQLHNLNDQDYLPDSVMGPIYRVNFYNDSIYKGQERKAEIKGIRFANGENNPNLEMLCTMYLEKHPGIITRYDINIDRKTKKVVYIEVNTN